MNSSYIKKECREFTYESDTEINATPVMSSTPKKSVRRHSYLNEFPIFHRSSSSLSRSSSFCSKKYHKDYDPDIELRQVTERSKKRISNSWADHSILHDEQDEDLQKYTGKCKKLNKTVKLEEDTEVLTRRQSEIDKGKIKQCYKNYVYEIGKSERKSYMPKTPNKFIKMSRRGWDGLVRKWKKHIHAWNEPNFEELFASGVTFDCCADISMSTSRTSPDISGDNLEHQDIKPLVKEEKRTSEERSPSPLVSRKRTLPTVKLERVDYDEDIQRRTIFEAYDDSALAPDLHSGLTNDTDTLYVSSVKRARLSASDQL